MSVAPQRFALLAVRSADGCVMEALLTTGKLPWRHPSTTLAPLSLGDLRALPDDVRRSTLGPQSSAQHFDPADFLERAARAGVV